MGGRKVGHAFQENEQKKEAGNEPKMEYEPFEMDTGT